ncbi:hypothetical protein FRC12_011327 [Ceratobasidium sp. 428]|nr:hypothetical protein FRC12_011327 [Ceratobasidium sp. 428]
MSADVVPRRRRASRRQPPVHITLPPPTMLSPPKSTSSPEGFRHIYPTSTPGRSSATPATERPNPFFILNEEDPPAPIHRLGQPAPRTPPATRTRPVLPPQVSLEHAFGVVRTIPAAPGRKDDHSSGTGDLSTAAVTAACSPRASKLVPGLTRVRGTLPAGAGDQEEEKDPTEVEDVGFDGDAKSLGDSVVSLERCWYADERDASSD